MVEKIRRPLAVMAVGAGVVLGAVAAGPLSWGLGVCVAVALIVGGAAVLTDRRPPHVRQRRPYNRERDGRAAEPASWTAARTRERMR